jgi:apolipoprotein N-acyltransferase
MSSLTLAEAGPMAVDTATTPVAPGPHPLVSGLTSGVLLWFAFPPADWGWLAWVALVPLFGLIASPRSRLSLYAGAWAGGMAFWLLSIQWVRLTDETAWLAWLAMASALSLWWPGFLALARLAVLRLRIPPMIAAPVLWVGLEFVRAYVLTGFPWYYLAHSQHRALPLIQIADFAGALGLSFLIAVVNAAWVDLLSLHRRDVRPGRTWLTRPVFVRLSVVAVLLAATVGYGAYRLGSARFRPGPRLALVQSNLLQRYKMENKHRDILAVYQRLIDRAVRAAERPDLIVWPETAYPYSFVTLDPALKSDAFERQARQLSAESTPQDWLSKMEAVSNQLHTWTDQLKVPMMVGSLTYDFHGDGLSKFNSAILFQPGAAAIQSYHKLHLVPFGEYVPLIETFPWLTVLTPYHGPDAIIPSLSFGRTPVRFTLGPYRLAVAICFEDTVPQVVRRSFDGKAGEGQPDILLNLSNDGWFRDSSEHDMHLAVSIFRAVENRVPLARAVNTGISAFIDGNGRVLAEQPKLQEGILARIVPLDDRVSLYSSWGDWVGLSCLAATLALLVLAALQPWLRASPPMNLRSEDAEIVS